MFTVSGFLVGSALFGVGFLMVWKRRNFRNGVGDLGSFFNKPGSSWLTWEVLGSVLMFVGFMMVFGIFQAFADKFFRVLLFPTIG